MIAMLNDSGDIVFGPSEWSLPGVLEPLIVAGFDLREGLLHGPGDQFVLEFQDAAPLAPLDLPGFRILPVVEVSEAVPEGKMLAGRDMVILADRVELRPKWADVPPARQPVPQTRYTPAEFMRLLTKDELDAVLVAEDTDVDVKRMWAFIRAVGYVEMTDPLTIGSLQLLKFKGYLASDERLQQIEDGVFQL